MRKSRSNARDVALPIPSGSSKFACDVVICRGCKCNLHLEDQMNTFRKARESLNRQMRELKRTIERAFK